MKKTAFTLAEVLITLVVIGVIAAITVPTLMNSYRKQQYVAGLKKSYATIQNGFKSYIATEGCTSIDETSLWIAIKKFYAGSMDAVSEVQNEINRIFNVSKQSVVLTESDEDYMEYSLLKHSSPDATQGLLQVLVIFMNDGSILYLQPYYESNVTEEHAKKLKEIGINIDSVWGRITVDINGKAKPNKFGRDVFDYKLAGNGTLIPRGSKLDCFTNGITSMDYCATTNVPYWDINEVDWTCRSKIENEGTDGRGCAARIMDEGWEMKY